MQFSDRENHDLKHIYDKQYIGLLNTSCAFSHSKHAAVLAVNTFCMTMEINPCAAELLQLYFSSFEAGIANAISSFKWRKILLFMKNRHV